MTITKQEPDFQPPGSAEVVAGAAVTTPVVLPGAGAMKAGGLPRRWVKRVARRWWIVAGVLAGVLLIALIRSLLVEPMWSASSQLYIDSGSGAMDLSGEAGRFGATRTLATALGLEGIGDLLTLPKRGRLEALRSALSVSVDRKDETLTVAFRSSSRSDAAALVNGIVRAYQILNSRDVRSPTAEALSQLEAVRAQSQKQIEEKTEALIEFKRRHRQVGISSAAGAASRPSGPGAPGPEATLSNPTLQRLAALSEALDAAQAQTLSAKTAYQQVQSQMKDDAAKMAAYQRLCQPGASAAVALDPQTLVEDLQRMEQRRLELSQRYLPRHPMMQALQGEIDQRSGAYLFAVEQSYQRARQREQELRASLESRQQEAIDLQRQEIEYARLEEELNNTRQVARDIAAQMSRSQTPVPVAAPALSVMVIEPASADEAVLLNSRGRMMLQGLGLGLLLGIVATFLDRRYRSEEEIADSLSLPMLGAIPRTHGRQSDSVRGKKVQLDPASEVADAYRTVRTGVYFGSPGGRGRSLVVTSPTSGEGRSTLASNLAIAMALSGQRTLLLDADFRSPNQHRIFQLDDSAGLSTVLAGRRSVEATIQRSGIKDLDILPAGPIPPNPPEILNCRGFEHLLKDLSERYGYERIVLDSPPALATSDASILAAMCDLTLLVVRAGKTSGRSAVQARDSLVSVGATILGTVVNQVPRTKRRRGPTPSATAYRNGQDASAGATSKAVISTQQTAKLLAEKIKAISSGK